MLRTVLIIGGVWFAVALVLGVILGRWLRHRSAPEAARERPQPFRNSA